MTNRLPVRVGLGVGLVAGSVLTLQVLLTWLFSAALFYHFSFLSISLALLGAGAGAIAVYVRPAWFERPPLERELALWSVVLALLLMVVLARLDFGTSDQVTLRFAGLLALLLWSGLGSLLARRARDPRRALTLALTVSCVVIAASAFGLLPLLAALIDLPFSVRVALTVLLLAPAGIPLGMAMPLGLGRLAELHPNGVAWAWGVNGVASVVASAGAITVAIVAGFPAATLVALACYAGALAHVVLGEWPQRARADSRRRRAPRESSVIPDPAEG